MAAATLISAAVLISAALVDGTVSPPPPPPSRPAFIFSDNTTPSPPPVLGGQSAVARGELAWPLVPPRRARLAVLPGLLKGAELAALHEALALVPSGDPWDRDLDSVDGKATYELYLSRSGSAGGISGIATKPENSGEGSGPALARGRAAARAAAHRILAPVLAERILPFVNAEYKQACGGGGGGCICCHSFVRRYRRGERRSHGLHFDIQALATVVVSLGSYGRDFGGGIYVATSGAEEDRRFVALQEGDALVHASDLLHGVDVGWGTRMSWILWFKRGSSSSSSSSSSGGGGGGGGGGGTNSTTTTTTTAAQCDESDPTAWHREEAEGGDPVAAFLHARRARTAREKVRWLRRSAEGGFRRAMNELGMAYLNKDPGIVMAADDGAAADGDDHGEAGEAGGDDSKDNDHRSKAVAWFRKAARLDGAHSEVGSDDDGGSGLAAGGSPEPDAFYNLGLEIVTRPPSGTGTSTGSALEISDAVAYFTKAAAMGHSLALHNLGIAHFKGAGGLARNLTLAVQLMEQSGELDALFQASNMLREAAAVAAAKAAERSGSSTTAAAAPPRMHIASEAERLLRLAASQGHVGACRALAQRHLEQRSVDAAAPWLTRAADAGDRESAAMLERIRGLSSRSGSSSRRSSEPGTGNRQGHHNDEL